MVEAHPAVSDLQAVTAMCKQIDLQLQRLRDDGDEVGDESVPDRVDQAGSTIRRSSCSRGAPAGGASRGSAPGRYPQRAGA